MIIDGTYRFAGPRRMVWPLLLDPEILRKTMPGVTDMNLVGDHRYEGKMRVGIGPITAAEFDVTIALVDLVEPASYGMEIDGRGKFGFTRGRAAVTLEEIGPDETEMRYRADLQVGGKIAAVGQRLLDSVSRLLARQGLEAMSREVTERL